MLLCTPFFFIFHKAYFSQLLIILQFAGESLSKYGFNKSSLLQANLITNSKGWPGTWLCGHFHRREKTEQWVVHSASCTQNCTNTAAVDFYVNWQQGQHCHFQLLTHLTELSMFLLSDTYRGDHGVKEEWFKIEWQWHHSTPPEKMYFFQSFGFF